MRADDDSDKCDEPSINPRDRVVSLERGLAVLLALGQGETMSLREVAAAAGVSRAAARRSLITLKNLGYVGESAGGYEIRPRVFEFGYAYLGRQPLTAVTTQHLMELVTRIDEFASVAVLDDGYIVHIVRETPPNRLIAVDINVGARYPAYATAQGRVLLAGLTPQQWEEVSGRLAFTRFTSHTVESLAKLEQQLDIVRRTGHAINDQQMTTGVRSVAVPIRDNTGTTVAALGSIVNAASWTLKAIRGRLVPELRQVAEQISHDLRPAPIQPRISRNGGTR
ncbi:IclR family transcriptional regulator domain-containing protein [Dactylosporangium sp. CA-092794]|uniref:IclR family transcriptional regulator domain-containing protein n=1 Tax=Dactylosporangium sp. CA-092794 TaxID=3239929 RepID=UPI003D8C79EF